MVAAGYEDLGKRFGSFQRFWALSKGSFFELQAWYTAPTEEYLMAWSYMLNESDTEIKYGEIMKKKEQ
jgi:hypothetical protein